MKAIAIIPGLTTLSAVERPEPQLLTTDDIKLKVIRVGICGTDREEAVGGRALLPSDQRDLVIGHEMFGQVVQVGTSVTHVKYGDFAIFTVRRGCGKCRPCAVNRSDMCRTGEYLERGIWGADGFQAEYVVDKEQYVVRIPEELAAVGVLTEPMSVAEKAIEEVLRVQAARLPDLRDTTEWIKGQPCLVAGLGPIGLLAALILRLRGAKVFGLDIVDESSPRARWLEGIGGQYIDARKIPGGKVKDSIGKMEIIFEATGIPSLEFSLLDALALDGAYVLSGIPGGDRPIEVHGAKIISRLVLGNQIMLGSVNASSNHYQMAVEDLLSAQRQWGSHIATLITHHYPFTEFTAAVMNHDDHDIKVVLEWQ